MTRTGVVENHQAPVKWATVEMDKLEGRSFWKILQGENVALTPGIPVCSKKDSEKSSQRLVWS